MKKIIFFILALAAIAFADVKVYVMNDNVSFKHSYKTVHIKLNQIGEIEENNRGGHYVYYYTPSEGNGVSYEYTKDTAGITKLIRAFRGH